MKTNWVVLAAAVVMTASTSFAGGGVNIGVYIGGPPPVYYQPAPVFVQPGPVYVQPAPVVVGRPVVVGGGGYYGRSYRGPRYVAAPQRVWVPGYWVDDRGKGKGHGKGKGYGRRFIPGYWR